MYFTIALLLGLSLHPPQTSQAVISVEIACPGFVDPSGGNGALAYHAPAYEAAIDDSNRLYIGIFNFSLVLITGDRSKILVTADMEDNASDLIAKWYYAKDRDRDSVVAIIAPGDVLDTSLHDKPTVCYDLFITYFFYRRRRYDWFSEHISFDGALEHCSHDNVWSP